MPLKLTRLQTLVVLSAALILPAPAPAQQLLQGAADDDSAAEHRWRGSMVFYSNAVNINSLQRDSQLSYNPMYAMQLTLLPRFWLSDRLFLRGILTAIHEFTDADETTDRGETLLTDTTVGVGAPLWQIPVIGVNTSATFDLRLPTSKWSRAEDLVLAAQANVNLFKAFPVLKGLSLSYTFGAARFFHTHTTGRTLEPSNAPTAGAVNPFFSSTPNDFVGTGLRNARLRIMHTGFVGLQILDWLSVGGSVTAMHDFLYPAEAVNPQDTRVRDINARDWMFYSCEVAFQPWDVAGLALVANTFNPQLHPDPAQTYYAPFFNRFTNLLAQVRFNVGALL